MPMPNSKILKSVISKKASVEEAIVAKVEHK